MAHIRVGKAYNGVQQDAPSANVAKLFLPTKTCVTLDADHGISCN